jgi:hypothetical protein
VDTAEKPVERDRFLLWGWLLSAFAVIVPPLAIGGIIFGAIVATRGKPGHGAGMIAVSVLGPIVFVMVVSTTLYAS